MTTPPHHMYQTTSESQPRRTLVTYHDQDDLVGRGDPHPGNDEFLRSNFNTTTGKSKRKETTDIYQREKRKISTPRAPRDRVLPPSPTVEAPLSIPANATRLHPEKYSSYGVDTDLGDELH